MALVAKVLLAVAVFFVASLPGQLVIEVLMGLPLPSVHPLGWLIIYSLSMLAPAFWGLSVLWTQSKPEVNRWVTKAGWIALPLCAAGFVSLPLFTIGWLLSPLAD